MRVLAIGDVCGSIGCAVLQRMLPAYRREHPLDLVIVNGENSADGNGITPDSAQALFSAGVQLITGGNHSLRRKEVYSLLDSHPYLLRPDNLPGDAGKGYALYDLGRAVVAVINLSGQVYLESAAASNPFGAADALLGRAQSDGATHVFVDFHAEATSEKRALGFYLDGRVTALFGTHTHVLTADAQVLPGGTGYITDLGMTGPIQSVLGVKSSIIIHRLQTGHSDEKFRLADGPCMVNGCLFETDDRTGRCMAVTPIDWREPV